MRRTSLVCQITILEIYLKLYHLPDRAIYLKQSLHMIYVTGLSFSQFQLLTAIQQKNN